MERKSWSHLTKDEQDAAFDSKSLPPDRMSCGTLFGTQDGIGLNASMDAISNSICSLNPSMSWAERQSVDSSTELDESATR